MLSLLAAGLLLLTKPSASVSLRPSQIRPESSSGAAEHVAHPLPPVFRLDVGLAGPPVVAGDGTWWLSGRDGELALLGTNDSPVWSISLGAAITGDVAIDEHGSLYVPTARDLIFAVEPNASVRWRSRVPWGIDGPLAWVPQQGLAFVGRDQFLYWLGHSANLLQRTPIGGRRSAGPIRMGQFAAVGSDTGEFFVGSSRGKRLQVDLGQRIRSISDWSDSALILAGNKGYSVDYRAEVRLIRAEIASIGVASDRESPNAKGQAVMLSKGRLDWFDHQGNVTQSLDTSQVPTDDLVPELAATHQCAWISSNSGTVWQCCTHDGIQAFRLTQLPLMRPVLDLVHGRVLVGSSQGELWSMSIPDHARF